jgi:hypothetical protein
VTYQRPRPRTHQPNERSTEAPNPPAGAEANARLTAATGLILLVVLVAKIVTVLLRPRTVLTLHVVIGLVLVPLVVLKLVSTIWRMVSYYQGTREYRIKEPPSPMIRVLGPVLGILTIALLASGIVLVTGPRSAYGVALLVHKKIFYCWLMAFALHVVAHFTSAIRLSYRDFGQRLRPSAPGARFRLAVVVGYVVLGVILGPSLGGPPAYLHAHPAVSVLKGAATYRLDRNQKAVHSSWRRGAGTPRPCGRANSRRWPAESPSPSADS